MITVRKNVFETNSSSTHSLCIQKNMPEKYPEYLKFSGEDFGWSNAIITDVQSKANYLYTALFDLCMYGNKKTFCGHRLDWWKNYIYTELGKYNIEVEFEDTDEMLDKYKYPNYYIDHCDMLDDFITSMLRPRRLMKYLFGENSFIITGNDNSPEEYDENCEKLLNNYDGEIFYKGN